MLSRCTRSLALPPSTYVLFLHPPPLHHHHLFYSQRDYELALTLNDVASNDPKENI